MDFKSKALEELSAKRSALGSKTGLVGFDGFIDRIRRPVGQRFGAGDDFAPIETITEFGERILRAAGESTNIELYPVAERLGGNGPILSQALLAAGLKVRYIGALGKPEIHPIFQDLADKSEAISIAEPSISHNLEFTDGKIMLGELATLDEISYDGMIEQIGEGVFLDLFSRMDLIALMNWTMIPKMSRILQNLLERVFPVLPPRDQRIFFFDLCDPAKRSVSDIRSVLSTISRFQEWGSVTLGLNLKEGHEIARALEIATEEPDEAGLRRLTSRIRQKLQIDTVVIHPVDSAACATRGDSWWIPGPFTEKPLTTTGGGDHFNAGFCLGQLMEASPRTSLTAGVGASGYFVRTGKSPSLSDIDHFLRQWK